MWGTKIKDLPFKLVVQSEIEIWRAADFWTKEPETIAWIDSFAPGSVFWDIGVNIGVFLMYASSRNVESRGFEPCIENHNALLDNREANKHDIRPFGALWLAVSDFDGKSTFYVPKSGPGRSGGQIGEARHENGQEFKPEESYEVETYKIDTLAAKFGVPNYIKIDVDGIEWRILMGGAETLSRPEVKSVLVEVNNENDRIEQFMVSCGFTSFNRFNGPDINRRANQKQKNIIYLRQ